MTDNPPLWRHRTPAASLAVFGAWLAGTALFVVCWNQISAATTWFFVEDAPRVALDIGQRMIPPKWSYLNSLWRPLWDTINIATLGTLLALVIATPVAFLAAHNTTPSAWAVRPLALLIIVSSRSINSLIWGLLLVTVIGPGVLAGILAISLRSVGFIAKLLYEAIEEIDESQVDAIVATGASRSQVLVYGIWPQILPGFVGTSLFRWDINIRESTILGLVGAGGIGLQLQASINTVAWSEVTVILTAIMATVIISEWASARLRARVT